MKVIGWHLVRLVAEAQQDLLGGTVEQIRRSPDRSRVALTIGSRGGKRFMILGVRGERAAFYWTRRRDELPEWSTYERTELFNRVRSAVVTGIGMAPNDRVVRFELERPDDEAPDRPRYSLVAAWVGSGSNIWSLDAHDDRILDSLHSDPDDKQRDSHHEPILSLPESPNLANWRSMTFPEYRVLRETDPDLHLSDFLRRRFWGIDANLARQITEVSQAKSAEEPLKDSPTSLRLWQEYQHIIEIANLATAPRTPLEATGASGDSMAVRVATEGSESATSLAELLADWDARAPRADAGSEERKQLFVAIESALKKNERRLASVERTLVEKSRADEYKHIGDLLGANRHLLNKGQSTIDVEDWRAGGTKSITLNPARSPQQNIDDYYRKSRKASDAVNAAESEKPHLLRERDRLRGALRRLQAADDASGSVAEILSSLGWESDALAVQKTRIAPRLPYREFALGKARLFVGRSSRDNDELTLRYARPQDLFFHVHGAPGSHVILRREPRDAAIAKDLITQAAQVAAYFSKAKHSGLVPVVYAEARFVRKPRKAPPGTVSIEREKTIMVRPLPPPGYHEKRTPK